ncbi:hypothetical protein APS56_12280 [Pseudalgibacter alginicilyticus]|uniref:Lipoprotein n=1 Tax=Pseudalgibacter alginicilyticus TaxID=1736674 RepID=A0A0P0CI46_9FLAO|nr:hypothetical protein [Pseudalgibacter alginicilyticus]ALJ05858.1 hypothetical protein APS56_12280 [Pseudalgibacter alginicilyticus]
MKFSKLILLIVAIILISCGSSERVITNHGTVYEVKGKKYFSNGNNVTEQLTAKEKENINRTLDTRLKAERLEVEKQEALKSEQARVKEEIEKAEEKQKALEKKQERLKDALEAKEKAREDVLKAKDKLQDKKAKYQKLKDAGKLSPRDEEKWNDRFTDLESDLEDAMQNLNKLK